MGQVSLTQLRYLQIERFVIEQIESGAWAPHHRIESELELARRFNVARGTVQRAILNLIEQKRVYRVPGKGSYVSAPTIEQPLTENLLSLSEALSRAGIAAETRVLEQRFDPYVELAPWVKMALGPSALEGCVCLKRLKEEAGTPIALIENYLPAGLLPGIERRDFTSIRLFDVIEKVYGLQIDWGSRTISAMGADRIRGRELKVPVGFALLYLEQVAHLRDNTVIECSRVWIRGDRLATTAVMKRATSGY